MGKRGPQPRPDDEQPVTQNYRCPRALADDVKQYIPKGERSGIIQAALRAEVERRKARAESQ